MTTFVILDYFFLIVDPNFIFSNFNGHYLDFQIYLCLFKLF